MNPTTTEKLPLSGPAHPRHETDNELLQSIRNLLRVVVAIWLTLVVLGAIGGYQVWQHSRCVESSSIYSSDC